MKRALGMLCRTLANRRLLVFAVFVLGCLPALLGTAAAQNAPHIHLQERRALTPTYKALDDAASLVASGRVQPRSLTSGDFDEDGVADLIAGYAAASGGVIVLHRGNLDALAPQSHESWQAIGEGRFPVPFVPEARAFQVPVSPDFVAAGNFTGHGHMDLIVASRSANAIYVFAGDGHGQFAAPQVLNLPGAVTAMGAGSLGLRQPFPSLIVSVRGSTAAALLVFRGSRQGLKMAGNVSLNGPAASVVFGNGSGASQAAVLVNGQVFLVHATPVALESVALPFSVSALAFGSFLYDRDTRLQMALLDAQGDVHIAAHDGFDPRPYSLMEQRLARMGAPRGRIPPQPQSTSTGWQIVESLPSVAPFPSSAGTPIFFRSRLSGGGTDDVVALNSFTRQMAVVSHPDEPEGATASAPGQVSMLSYNGSPVAALPLRINVDGRPGIVALHDAEVAPSVMTPGPAVTFWVNRTDDPVPTSPITDACNNTSPVDESSSCSLRESVIRANAAAGTDTIMVPAGTFTLTQPRMSGDYTAYHGTLDVTDSVNIVGAGQNTTIIQAGTTNSNGVDKVFSFNEDLDGFTNATVSLSSLTVQFGYDRGDASDNYDGYGGAFDYDTGGTGSANLTVTSCTITDNSTSDGDGGGIAIFNTNFGVGFAAISNSIIQNNTVQVTSTGAGGIGGGIFVGTPGALVLSNTQILNNNAVQTTGQGGGLYVFGPSGSTQTTIHGSTISGNHASAQGGGIVTTAGLLIDQGTIISNNQSGTDGGGLWHNTFSETTTINKATITGNTATGNGGGIQVDSGNTGNILAVQFSRITGNSAALGSGLNQVGGTVTATNNWWGTNSPAGTINGTVTFDPFIVLAHSASPATIHINQSSTLTGDMSQDNHGSGTALIGNLDVLVGLPITFDNPAFGTIPEAQPEALDAGGQATATFTAGGTGGQGHADATVDNAVVTTDILVLQPPSIVKSFNPTTVVVNVPSTVTFSVTNGNVVPINASFTDTLAANLVVATTPSVVNNCGGSVTATAGSGSISFTNGAFAIGTCTILVNVQGTVDAVFGNSVSIASTDAGNGNTSSANLTVINPPSIVKAFGAATIPLNGSTSLTFTITSTNAALAMTGVAFTDSLPAGLVVATPNGLSSTCGGTTTAVAGSSTASLSGATLAASATCAISVNVTGTTAGVKNNSVTVSSTNAGTGNTSNASVTVAAPPVIIKAFGAASIPLSGSTSLTFTIQNNNTTTTLSAIAFSDTLPSGLVISTPNGLSGTCGGGTITSTQGTNVISLSGATLAQSTSCTFSANVTGTTAGTKNNTTGNVTSTEGGTGGTASASVNVVAPPSIAKAFGATGIPLNGTTSLTLTMTNPVANAVAETGVAFTDTLPAGLVVATPNGLTNTCGGTATAVAGSGSASLTGGTIATSSTCAFTVNVTGTATGNFTNTTGNVASTNGGTGNTGTANLAVAAPPAITKAFGSASIALNGSTSLTFSLTNPNATLALTGVAFTDSLPAGLVVATPNGLTSTCGGTATAVLGAGSASLSAGTLAVSATCTISVNVTGTTAGVKNNSVQVTSTESGVGNTSNASVTVAAPPVIIKAFGAASIPLNGSTSLSFTIQNNNTTTTLSGIAFSDTLPGGLVVSTPNGLSGTCGGGTITATAGASVVSLATATLSQSSSCTFAVNVTGTTAGTKNNTTGNVASTEGGTGGTASASVNVFAPPSIAKAFGAVAIPLNGTTSLTLTLTNPVANAVAETGVAFTDTLPAGLVVATPNGLTNTCGGTATAVAGSGSASLTGGTIASSSTCTLTMNVTGTATGNLTNTTGSVTSTNGGTGNTASANLAVAAPPAIAKAFGAPAIALNGSTSLIFTLTNPVANTIPLTGVAFTDALPAGLAITTPSGLTNTCGGTATAVAGAGSASLSAGALAINTSCTISVNITGTTSGVKNNSVQVTSTEGGVGNTSNATVTVAAPPVIIKAFGAASIPLNGSTSLSFTIQNNNTTTTLSGIAFSDTLPAGLIVSTPDGLSGTCGGGTITAAAGAGVVSLATATLAQSSSCTFAVNVTGTTAGTKNNTTGAVTSTQGGTGGTASASVAVVAPLTITKAFGVGSIPPNGTTTLSFTITNPAANTLAQVGVAFTDTFPAGLVVASPNGVAGSCGGVLTAVAGSGSVSLTGGTVSTNTSCTVSVNVTTTLAGTFVNTTGAVTSTNGGTGNAASATLSSATPPILAIGFGAATIPLNGSTSLSFTVTNPPANSVALTAVAFSDTLPAGLVLATPNGVTGTCGSGTITAIAGSSTLSLSGGTLSAGGACTFSVNVTGETAGVQADTSGTVSSAESGPGATSNTATVTVVAPPSIAIAFGAASVSINGTTSLTFTIDNPNATVALTAVGFSDSLPAGLIVDTPNGATGSCGAGAITAAAGSSTVSLSAGTIGASGSCVFSVNVKAVSAGTKLDSTGNVISGNGGMGNAASASLDVMVADLTITDTHAGNFVQAETGVLFVLTVTNDGTGSTSAAVTVVDTLPAGLTATAIGGTGWTCTLSSHSCTRSDVLAPGNSYAPVTLTATVSSTAPASILNSATVSGGAESNTANDTATDTAAVSGFGVVNSPASITIRSGQTATYTVVVASQGPQLMGDVTLVVSGLPPQATCTLQPSPVTLGASPTTSTLIITTMPGDGVHQPTLRTQMDGRFRELGTVARCSFPGERRDPKAAREKTESTFPSAPAFALSAFHRIGMWRDQQRLQEHRDAGWNVRDHHHGEFGRHSANHKRHSDSEVGALTDMERYCHKLLTMLAPASRFAGGVFTGMVLAMCAPGCCQSAPQTTQHFEVSGSYSYVRANSSSTGESFNLQGGSVSGAYRLGRGVSIAGDVGGYYFTDLPDGVSGRIYTYVVGPRFYFRRQARLSPFGEILLGAARHTAETATDQAGENSFALLLGGGLDLNLSHNFAIRAVQADYLMTRFAGTAGDSAIQNNMRLSAGIVFRF